MSKLIIIGYWEGDDDDILYPHPRYLTDKNWKEEERYKIARYLHSGPILWELMGYSHCRFPDDGLPDEKMGCTEKTDGVWIWPEALPIYIERYSVRLPEDFLNHVYQRNFQIPKNLDLKLLEKFPVDDKFWLRWARRKLPEKYSWWLKYLPRSYQVWYLHKKQKI